jgi:hypothetical protein
MIRKIAVLFLLLAATLPVSGQVTSTLTTTLSVAQITTCNSSPIVILPATPGVAYLPVRAATRRLGDRYATGSGDVNLIYSTVPVFIHMYLDSTGSSAGSILLGPRRSWLGIMAAFGRYGTDEALAADIGGKAVLFRCGFVGHPNPTVNGTFPGSDIELTVVYETWPVATP